MYLGNVAFSEIPCTPSTAGCYIAVGVDWGFFYSPKIGKKLARSDKKQQEFWGFFL